MSSVELGRATTFLFVPANRPDRFDKAAASGADVVILDLEDAVPPGEKEQARAHARAWLSDGGSAVVRVNGRDTRWFDGDLAILEAAAAVVLPKAESDDDLTALREVGRPVLPLIETPRGLAAAPEICRDRLVARVGFGNVDFAAEIGVDPGSHAALSSARSQLVYASAAAGCAAPVDGVTTALRDQDVLTADAAHARELGFTAKLLIHPAQVAPVRQIMAPSAEEVAWARGVLESEGDGARSHEGHMLDEPVLRRARAILARAGT